MFAALGASAFVLRLTSAFIAILGLAVTYRFVRTIFSPWVALGALAWMAVSLWPIFFSRVGLRSITLPVMTALAACFLWRALEEQGARSRGRFTEAKGRKRDFVIAGALLGLTLYTYQGSRVFPIVFGVFLIYLFATRRISAFSLAHVRCSATVGRLAHPSSLSWRNVVVFFVAAGIIAAPLAIYLTVINPHAEERIADLSGPLTQLGAGDPSEVIRSTSNTLGMFTIRGDAVPIYNLSDRPVFPEPVGAALFYLGLLISLWRWKRPAYALMLIWFFISLVPAMVTPFSPNFVRTMGVWPVPFVFVGIGMMSIGQWVNRATGRLGNWATSHRFTLSSHHLVSVFFALVLVFNGLLTARDYFLDWPRGDYVRFWQQASWTQTVRAINADPSNVPIAASGLSIHDFDPETFDLLSVRSDLKVKWFDCRGAVVYANTIGATRYLLPNFYPCDVDLWARYVPDAKLLAQPRWPDTGDPIFSLYEFDPYQSYVGQIRERINTPVYLGSERFDAQHPQADLEPIGPPKFGGLQSFGAELVQTIVKPGATLSMTTFWTLTEPIAPPLKIFVHVTAPDGRIVAQWDGLDVNIGTLEPRDLFIQRHRIELPPDLPPGPYRVSLGAYHPDSGTRLSATVNGHPVDSIIIGTLTLIQ